MDAWLDSLAIAIAVLVLGTAALGSQIEPWHARAVRAPDGRCVALRAGPLDHQPKCATSTSPLADDAEHSHATRGAG
jgi:hypothetical protein